MSGFFGGGGGSTTTSGVVEYVAAVSATNSRMRNTAAIQTAITQAETAALAGQEAVVKIPQGTWKIGYPYHAQITSNITLSVGATLTVDDASDWPTGGSNTINLLARWYATQVQASNIQATITYNTPPVQNSNGTWSVTIATIPTGADVGKQFTIGDTAYLSGQAGAYTQELLKVTNGNIRIEGYGAILDVSTAVYAKAPVGNNNQGPRIIQIGKTLIPNSSGTLPTINGSATAQTNFRRYGKGHIWPGQQWVDIGRAFQTNDQFDGTYNGTTKELDTGDWMLISQDGTSDYDAGRYNPMGEIAQIMAPGEFGSYLANGNNLSTPAGSGYVQTIQTQLRIHRMPDPYGSAALLSNTLNAGATSMTVVDPRVLTYNPRQMDNEALYQATAGMLYITDGPNEEFIHYESIDFTNRTLNQLARNQLSTTAPTGGWAPSATLTTAARQWLGNPVINVAAAGTTGFTSPITISGVTISFTGTTSSSFTGCSIVSGTPASVASGTSVTDGTHTTTTTSVQPLDSAVFGTFGLVTTATGTIAPSGSVWIPPSTNTSGGFVNYTGVVNETTYTILTGCTTSGSTGDTSSGTNRTMYQRTAIMAELVRVGTELIAYTRADANGHITILRRNVGGPISGAGTHIAGTTDGVVQYVPPPGRVMINNPIQSRVGYESYSFIPSPAATLAKTFTSDATAGQITVETTGLDGWDLDSGVFQIDNEVFTYTHRDTWRYFNVTPACHGTTAATHTAGASITPLPMGGKLTAAVTDTTGTSFSINGFRVIDLPNSNDFVRVEDEICQIKGGLSTSGTTNGRIYTQTTLNGGLDNVGASGTIAITSATGFVDPVATGVDWAFAEIGSTSLGDPGIGNGCELVQYTGINTGVSPPLLTGVRRGYKSKAQVWATNAQIRCYTTLNISNRGDSTALSANSVATTHAAGTGIRPIQPYYIRKTQFVENVHVKGLTIYSTPSTPFYPRAASIGAPGGNTVGNRKTAIYNYFSRGCTFEDVHIDGTEHDGIVFASSTDGKITNSLIENVREQGWGYSTLVKGASQDIVIANNVMRKGRHGGDSDAGPQDYDDTVGYTRRVHFVNNHVQDMLNAAYECHSGNEDTHVQGNTVVSCSQAFIANGTSVSIKDNIIKNCTVVAQICNYTHIPGWYEFEGNQIINCGGSSSDAQVQVTQDQSPNVQPAVALSLITIARNTWRGGSPRKLEVRLNYNGGGGRHTNDVYTGIRILNNLVHGGNSYNSSSDSTYVNGGNGAQFFLRDLYNATIVGNIFTDVPIQEEALWTENVNYSTITGNVAQYRSGLRDTGTAITNPKPAINVVTGTNNVVGANVATNNIPQAYTTLSGSNNKLVFSVKDGGGPVTVTYTTTGTLGITVTGRTVALTYNSGVTTAAQITAQITGNTTANAMLNVGNASGNTGVGTITADQNIRVPAPVDVRATNSTLFA